MWAAVDTDESEVQLEIKIYPTGATIDLFALEYLATVQDGALVWHVFIGDVCR